MTYFAYLRPPVVLMAPLADITDAVWTKVVRLKKLSDILHNFLHGNEYLSITLQLSAPFAVSGQIYIKSKGKHLKLIYVSEAQKFL